MESSVPIALHKQAGAAVLPIIAAAMAAGF